MGPVSNYRSRAALPMRGLARFARFRHDAARHGGECQKIAEDRDGMSLEIGDKAPDFTLPTDGGGKVSLKELKGKAVILYFYPKDDTSGCTAEACGFRDQLPDFSKVKAQVIGVSKDSVDRHDKFKKKYGLNFPLVSDEDGKICAKYGTWIEKSLYGRKYMGIDRATFVIDKTGTVAKVWRKVKVPGHVEQVLEAVKAL
jgi:thioredoxin-dependent peroxiredoxin